MDSKTAGVVAQPQSGRCQQTNQDTDPSLGRGSNRIEVFMVFSVGTGHVAGLRTLFGEDASILRESDFQLLLLANTIGPLGLAMISPVLDSLIGPYGTSAGRIGLMMSMFTAPAIVMVAFMGATADRYGRKRVLVGSLLLFGVAGVAIPLTTDFRVALALRFVQGVAWGGQVPIIITSLGDLYEGTREATAQGLRFTGSGVSATVSPLLAGLLVGLAWQYPFLLYALSFPVAVLVALWFEEPTTGGESDDLSEGTREYVRRLASLVRQPRVLSYILARGVVSIVWLGFLTFNSLIVVNVLDSTPAVAGLLAALGSVMMATGASQAGRITGMYESRFYPLLGGNVVMGAGFVIFVLAPSTAVAAVGVLLEGAGFGLVLAMYRSIITGFAPKSLRAGLVSLAESVGRLSDTLTPVAIGLLISALTPLYGFEQALVWAGLAAGLTGSLGGIVLVLVARKAPAIDVSEFESGAEEA